MNMDTDNLKLLIKHNRRIVERAYNQSIINAQYAFPKKKQSLQTDSDANDMVSLQSRVSERYNLHQQNLINHHQKQKERPIVPISMLIKQKQNKKTEKISKNKDKDKKSNICTNKVTLNQQKDKFRKYISLSPHRFHEMEKSSKKIQVKSYGIKITRQLSPEYQSKFKIKRNLRSKQKQKDLIGNFAQNIFQSIKKFTERCFSADNKNHEKKQDNEVVFHFQKLALPKEKQIQDKKVPVSERTADTTPTVGSKDLTNPENRKGIYRFPNHQHVRISPFNF